LLECNSSISFQYENEVGKSIFKRSSNYQIVDMPDILNASHSGWDDERTFDQCRDFLHHDWVRHIAGADLDERHTQLHQEVDRNLKISWRIGKMSF